MTQKVDIGWRGLYDLHSGLIGKSLWIISLAIPVSHLLSLGIQVDKYAFSVIGALIIALSFVITRIKTPLLITRYRSAFDYANDTISIHKREELDLILEFKIIEMKKSQVTTGLNDEHNYFTKFKDISQYIEELGDSKAVRNMALIKYDLINKESYFLRIMLFVLFLLGLIFLYVPLINSIFKILKEMLIQ